jgi:hypothetical protein
MQCRYAPKSFGLGYQTDENHNLIRSNHILNSPLQRPELRQSGVRAARQAANNSLGAIGRNRTSIWRDGEMATVMLHSFLVTGVVTMCSQ